MHVVLSDNQLKTARVQTDHHINLLHRCIRVRAYTTFRQRVDVFKCFGVRNNAVPSTTAAGSTHQSRPKAKNIKTNNLQFTTYNKTTKPHDPIRKRGGRGGRKGTIYCYAIHRYDTQESKTKNTSALFVSLLLPWGSSSYDMNDMIPDNYGVLHSRNIVPGSHTSHILAVSENSPCRM